jgi:hypothetical protein
MNKLIKDLQELIEKKADNHDLKQELSALTKMLKTGFEATTTGMEKIPKVYASNDAEKIKKFYDTFGNQIVALQISGNFDLFTEDQKVTYGINIEFTSESSPNIQYIKKDKKRKKFDDLFTGYFISEVPKSPKEAIEKILKSLDALTKDFTAENDLVKESLKEIIESQTEHSPATVKTVDKILTSARLKSIKVEDVATALEETLNLQQQGVDIALGGNKDDEDV